MAITYRRILLTVLCSVYMHTFGVATDESWGENNVIVIPSFLPKDSHITNVAAATETLEFRTVSFMEVYAERLFYVTTSGDLKTKEDLHAYEGKTFNMLVNHELKSKSFQDIFILNIQKTAELFVFPRQHYLGFIKENLPPYSPIDINGNMKIDLLDTDADYTASARSDSFTANLSRYHLHTKKSLDRESESEYLVPVVAKLSSGQVTSCDIRVIVLDENDCKPKFSLNLYEKSVHSDVKPGSFILKTPAYDADLDHLSYSLQGTTKFEINSLTGEIFSSEHLHSNVIYKFRVYAEDMAGQQTSSQVRISTGLSMPLKFAPHHHLSKRQATTTVTVEKTYEVFENQTAGTVILNIATEPSPIGASELYSIVSSSVDVFQVDTHGNVYLKGLRNLDYEDPSDRNITIVFNITSRNPSDPSKLLTVHLHVKDINDEGPAIINKPRPYLATVSTNPGVGEYVYELVAYDPDTNSNIQYNLESGGEGKFTIENVVSDGTHVGRIVTTVSGNGQFEQGTEFELVVSAQDLGANGVQKSKFEIVKVLVGHRPPQFYENPYTAYIPENNQAGFKLQTKEGSTLRVEAKPFQSKSPEGLTQTTGSIDFHVMDSTNQSSSVFSINSEGEVEALQSLDYERSPHSYYLTVIGKEKRTGYASSTKLTVFLQDLNDNNPIFDLSTYTNVTSEGTPVNSTLFSVAATDRDSGINAELTYYVSDDHFFVDTEFDDKTQKYIGIVKVAKRLDYDFRPDRQYKLNITAVDKGHSPLSGQASIVLYVTNINDEPPKFGVATEDVYASIREDQKRGSYVTTVQAVDPDGDNVEFYFSPRGEISPDTLFRIEPNSGIISLRSAIPASIPSYTLNITAYDDGSCCGGYPKLSSESYIVVEIKDINNNNPSFPACKDGFYDSTIMENQPLGTSVVTVKAVDPDRGPNGQITYSVVKPADQVQYFDVNPVNGTVYTNYAFNRESKDGQRGYSITIKAEDHGEAQQLNTLCNFLVTIGDMNDNPPKFDTDFYTQTVVRSLTVKKRVMGVLAIDEDMGTNAEVEYYLVENPGEYFRIDKDTGGLYLEKSLLNIPLTQNEMKLKVMAKDRGVPSLNSNVSVTITLTTGDQDPPTWDEDYDTRVFTVEETAQVGFVIAKLRATSHVPPPLDGVSFALIDSNGNPSPIVENFKVDTSGNVVKLKVQSPLDFNVKNSYTLRLRVSNQGLTPLSDEIRITVQVKDMNNKQPKFEGLDPTLSNSYRSSVPENELPGQPVITIKAVDPDHEPPSNVVSYSLVPDKYDAYLKFKIDSTTGLITTNYTFDREAQKVYYINVMAKDGRPSDLPFHEPPGSPNSATAQVFVTIADKNDNTPYFEKVLYEEDVDEQGPDTSKAIVTVKALDIDDADTLTYSITSGNMNNIFSIKKKTGDIYVARDLDFETPPNLYILNVTVNDGYHTNTTEVRLTVNDVNDNAPEFTQNEYIITDVIEEQQPPPGGQFLVQVSATDKDTSRRSNFRYSLSYDDKDSTDPTFTIEPITGKIFLRKPLDRDRPGNPEYQFNIMVMDEPGSSHPLTGYAYVRVKPKDINDNKPQFTKALNGYIFENTGIGKNVMNVRATDNDLGENGTVYYRLGNNKPADAKTGDSLFTINSLTGLITSNTNTLDREKLDRYYLPVIATDGGVIPQSDTATVTITVLDVNDESPKFLKKIYRATLSESQTSGQIITVSATDDDIGENSKLTYSLESDLNFFSIVPMPSNTGVINVYKPVDYEDVRQRRFNLTVKARDNNPLHQDEAYVEIVVTDANDEAPEFTEPVKTVTFDENIAEKTLLYTFTASDADSPPNDEFSFSIGDNSDRFYVEQIGNKALVRITRGLDNQTLDRETSDQYNVEILAIDKGYPPQTGTATLRIRVNDLNDNYPTFWEDYRPKVMEDEPPGRTVLTFRANDPDTLPYGRPFYFRLPPCKENPTCVDGIEKFSLIFNQRGADGNGTGTIIAKERFFREEKKFYYLPVIMSDMGNSGPLSMSGTSTLTIEIDDKNNNPHTDGFKEIFVYNYKGLFGDIEIGRANANDPDDYDFKDKYYYFIGPANMEQFFSVKKINGSIVMKKGVPGGTFQFKVLVQDFRVFTQQNATATIRVTVREISEEAVYNSGSVRLTGTSAEEFVERDENNRESFSNYDKFRRLLAEKIQQPVNNVEIFSVMNNGKYTDIRYAAHGSPYYPSSKLDGVVSMYQTEFEAASGGKIAMVNIDECLKEICDSGGCSNILKVDNKNPNVVNTKTQSFVGVSTRVVAECRCEAKDFSRPLECHPKYCYNGGTCTKDDWGDLHCSCQPGFNGARCQQTTHSFSNGYALYPPLAQCENSVTSTEFATKTDSALIFYNGPSGSLANHQPRDFISLALIGGYPQVIVDHGSGNVTLYVDGKDRDGITRMKKLSDGAWHHVDIIRKGQEVTVIVDHCTSSVFQSSSETIEDRRPCEATGTTLGRNKYLNVNHMLQMGGRYDTLEYPSGLIRKRFNGCIRNFIHNGELYDLYTSRNHPGENHRNGCPEEEAVCNTIQGRKCGPYGRCQIVVLGQSDVECVCHPGYRPSEIGSQICDRETSVRDLRSRSYMTWSLKRDMFNVLDKQRISFQLRFRTRDADGGVLFHLPSNSQEFITLQIVNNRIELVYSLDDVPSSLSDNVLSLSTAPANNGQWHTVYVQRIGRWFQLKMDSGEGRYFNETYGSKKDSQFFFLKRNQIVAGARVSFDPSAYYNGRGLTQTCITDIRLDNKWFPMKTDENTISPAAILEHDPAVEHGCNRTDCLGVRCPEAEKNYISQVCYPLFDHYECRCPVGTQPHTGVSCTSILYCTEPNPCKAGGKCIELGPEKKFRCVCPPGFQGPTCNQQASTVPEEAVAAGGVTSEVIIIIIVSIIAVLLIAFLVFLLLWVVNRGGREKSILYDDQYDDIRENVMDHDEDGAGEEDQECYDISRLQKPNSTMDRYQPLTAKLLGRSYTGDPPEVGDFIEDRLRDIDEDPTAPPHDNVMEFDFEGCGSDAGSLSSLNTASSDSDQEYNYLEDWGPKFAKLANMYNTGEEDS